MIGMHACQEPGEQSQWLQLETGNRLQNRTPPGREGKAGDPSGATQSNTLVNMAVSLFHVFHAYLTKKWI